MTKPMWACPKCGAKLVQRNLSHACGPHTVEAFLTGKSSRARELFTRFRALLDACGPNEVAPAKTRVAFMAEVRFASVNRLGGDSIDVHFVLPRRLKSVRFRRIERIDKLFVHHLRLKDDEDFDDELRAWLLESYREYGQRGWLTR